MTNKIHLTIILPMLNAEEDIEQLFTFIRYQTDIDKKTIEIVVINDGSSDTTLSIIEKHQLLLGGYHSLRIISHKQREGLTQTRLDGANAAEGTFITFIDKKARPDPDYLFNLINKKHNIVIGNPYVKKTRSLWGRVLALVRYRIYYPYFNHTFEDILLDQKSYEKFKNKGGGGCMYVRKDYYLKVAAIMPHGIHVNDDSLFIHKLSEIEPVLKTSTAKLEYMNRTGFWENVKHLYDRGPKFVNFYATPRSRFFMPIIALVVSNLLIIVLLFIKPLVVLWLLLVALGLMVLISIYLAQEMKDFFVALFLLPIATLAFSAGVIHGLFLKLLHKS